jgi:DNA polymerase-3 subunit gamma/tau
MGLDNKYRPQRFDDVWGQEHAVEILRGLVLAGQKRRNLLLIGDYGSGKTTLVRIYARALNCERVTSDGSPCNECESCTDPNKDALVEYDVPGRGGEKEQVRPWVDALNRAPINHRVRVLFFDETQALTPKASDSLLKDVEEPEPGVVFCFATTEPWKLKQTLKSRPMTLQVRALSASEAIEFLEEIANRECIAYDRKALALLAAVKRGHPRDLLIGLEQVASLGSRVTLDAVKNVFDIDQLELLVSYFLALAHGDCTQQAKVMTRWKETLDLKIDWVQAFLTSLYYNDLLGQQIILDGLTHSIEIGRAEIVSRFCARLNLDSPRALLPYWEQMMAFWLQPKTDDQTVLRLRLALFEDLVSRKLPETVGWARIPEFTPAKPVHGLRELANAFQSDAEKDDRGPELNTELRYFGPKDVREIISRASFFIQHHGRLMNAAFKVIPSCQARSSEEMAVETVKRFGKALGELLPSGGEPLASITVLERDENGVFGQIVAHIPQVATKSPDRNTFHRFLVQWCRDWLLDEQDTDKPLVECSVQLREQELKFHWDKVLNLCAAMGEEDLDDDDAFCRPPLLQQLGIPKRLWRQAGPIRHPLVLYSDLLSRKAIDAASALGMEPLSAFDAKAWEWIRNGWELKEHRDRHQTIAKRRQQIEHIKQLCSRDEQECQSELNKAYAEWPTDPELRSRSWSGWWHVVR